MKKLATYTIINPKKPDSHLSGGFASVESFVKCVEELGYNNQYITPSDTWMDPEEFDLVIYADIFNDPRGSPWFSDKQYESLFLTRTKYLVMECAYTGCVASPYGDGGRINGGNYEKTPLSEYMKRLMERSTMNIFLSPLHKREFEKFLGVEIENYSNFYQIIDTSVFYNNNTHRDIPFLYVGALNIAKGIDRVVELFGERGLVVVGRADYIENKPEGITFLGSMLPEELAMVYNRTVNFVHLPAWQEPFARTVLEAALCGCNLILNENVGATSFGLDIRNPTLGKSLKLSIQDSLRKILLSQ